MDIVSHGLWGGVAFGRKSRKPYLAAFFFGVMPDLFAFVPQIAMMLFSGEPWKFAGKPSVESIAPLTFSLYNISHSLIIFAAVFGIVWAIRKKPFIPMLAWGLHILCDIPTHSAEFFPTPFLWPFSSFKVNGFSWGQEWFMILNYSLLILVYIFVMLRRRQKKPQV